MSRSDALASRNLTWEGDNLEDVLSEFKSKLTSLDSVKQAKLNRARQLMKEAGAL